MTAPSNQARYILVIAGAGLLPVLVSLFGVPMSESLGAYLTDLLGLLLIPVVLIVILNVVHRIQLRGLDSSRGDETIVDKHTRALFR